MWLRKIPGYCGTLVEEIHTLCGGRGNLEYGSFVQAKEGALSICPVNENIKKLTDGTWKEEVSFAEGIRRMLPQILA